MLWADPTTMAVLSISIAKHFHVVEDINQGKFAGFADAFLISTFLRLVKKRFADGVIPTSAVSTHAGFQAMLATESYPGIHIVTLDRR